MAIDVLESCRVTDRQAIWTKTNDRTIGIMEVPEFVDLVTTDDGEDVEEIRCNPCCRTRIFTKRMKVKVVENRAEEGREDELG